MMFSAFLIITIFAVVGAAHAEDTDVKDDGKQGGHTIGSAARQFGHDVKKAAKEIGPAAKQTGKAIGHGAKQVGKAIGHTAKDAVTAIKKGGESTKPAAKGDD
jgi:hypothetical protein